MVHFDVQLIGGLALHEGRIAEMGSHQELLTRGGLYAALHGMQFNA